MMTLLSSIFSSFRTATIRLPAMGLAASLALSGCAPGSGLPPLPQTASTSYTLGPGEEVRVVIFGQTQLTGRFTVSDRGTISVPLLGDVPAEGKTTGQLAQTIATELEQRKLLNSPSVSVEVSKYRPVFILGEVVKPGQYPYEPGMTALTLVAIAGGFTYRAQTGYVSILRKEDGHVIEGRAPRGEEIEPGDVVTIFERYF
ncbi:MAG TPA: polysaccharide biosynthesis/export family protein [Acidisoma sp.]|uniref:polysaccharide biosynthesis/export family protein n=1 Tax=Acidisoma sp. TaxID=1872115 RepID=UPI002C8887BD|nr:polysaccharide biosynthesis/export family protein [Acidisoma sp.]HTI01902.1 polysaccharide biosynthesis/export family protein [Acidisoma sp.]